MRYSIKNCVVGEVTRRLETFQSKELGQWVSSHPNFNDFMLDELKVTREDLDIVNNYPSIKQGVLKWRYAITDRHVFYQDNAYKLKIDGVIDGMALDEGTFLDSHVGTNVLVTKDIKNDIRLFLWEALDLQTKHVDRVIPQLKHLSPTFSSAIANVPAPKRNRALPERAQAIKDRYDGSPLYTVLMAVSLDDGEFVDPFQNIIIK